MQTRPDQSTLLEALASFLMADVAPKLEADKALQFRVLIAANLATVIAGERRTEATRLAAELARLRALLDDTQGADDGETLARLNVELAARLRRGALAGARLDQALEHLLATAKETLEVTNPRFDLSDEPG
jgi:hypothetical protein